jgi:prophage regulatory protein
MSLEHSPTCQLLRPRDVCKLIGRSRTSLWRDVRAGLLPPPIETGRHSIAWELSVIQAWVASRPRRCYSAPQPSQAA